MIINLQPGCKCSLCGVEFNIEEQCEYYVDENGYVRIAHTACYNTKYK